MFPARRALAATVLGLGLTVGFSGSAEAANVTSSNFTASNFTASNFTASNVTASADDALMAWAAAGLLG